MSPILETVLMRQHELRYQVARGVVDQGRENLGMEHWEAPTPELLAECERILLENRLSTASGASPPPKQRRSVKKEEQHEDSSNLAVVGDDALLQEIVFDPYDDEQYVMYPTLETVLGRRYGVNDYEAARSLVQKARRTLGMASWGPWNPQLEKLCEKLFEERYGRPGKEEEDSSNNKFPV
jgi:hypothetical protein